MKIEIVVRPDKPNGAKVLLKLDLGGETFFNLADIERLREELRAVQGKMADIEKLYEK